MSIHPSLRGADTLTGERSVFKRIERVNKLIKDGKLTEDGSSALGLPKVRTRMKVAKKKAEAAPAAAPAAAAAAAPAKPEAGKGAAPAKGAAAAKPAAGGKAKG